MTILDCRPTISLPFVLIALAGCSASRPPAATAHSTKGDAETFHVARADASKTDEERCQGGDGAACFAAARALPPGGDHGAKEEALFARGCEAKHVPSCIEDGRALAWGRGAWANRAKGASLLRVACEAHQNEACTLYGELLRGGSGVEKDLEHAESLLRPACERGDMHACNGLALIVHETKPADTAAMLALFKKGCDGGYAYACRNLVLEDKSLPSAAALVLLTRACSGEAPMACTDLGVRYTNGDGVATDPAIAAQKFERACDGDDATGCHWLGTFAREGRGVAKDPARAAGFFARACDDETPAACVALGALLVHGEGVPENASHALDLFVRACRAHDGSACRWTQYVAGLKLTGEDNDAAARLEALCSKESIAEACMTIGTSLRPYALATKATARSRALAAFTRACDLGLAEGCTSAHATRERAKMPADPKLLKRACALDADEGCRMLAEALLDGSLGKRDRPAAREAATRACDAGSANGCAMLAHALDVQGASAADVARAASLLQTACDKSEAAACRDLAEMVRRGRGVKRDPDRAVVLDERADDLDD